MRYPPSLTWDGVPPRPGMGYPPQPDLRWGTPPASVDRHTDSCQNITFPRTMYVGGNNYKQDSQTETERSANTLPIADPGEAEGQ